MFMLIGQGLNIFTIFIDWKNSSKIVGNILSHTRKLFARSYLNCVTFL
jgi:hypothetical protein